MCDSSSTTSACSSSSASIVVSMDEADYYMSDSDDESYPSHRHFQEVEMDAANMLSSLKRVSVCRCVLFEGYCFEMSPRPCIQAIPNPRHPSLPPPLLLLHTTTIAHPHEIPYDGPANERAYGLVSHRQHGVRRRHRSAAQAQ